MPSDNRQTLVATSESAPSSASTIDWGVTDYQISRNLQETRVADRIAGLCGDSLIFTEHPAVFTIGVRRGSEDHLIWNQEQLDAAGVQVVNTNRGGDITYHGPGQIVGYPIISLDAKRDLHHYLRSLEQVLIDAVAAFGLQAERREGKTGIWIGSRKVAAIGVAVRRWVTYHGFALNVNVNLAHFEGIVPCGISSADGTVTSMEAELGHSVSLPETKRVLAEKFWKQFG